MTLHRTIKWLTILMLVLSLVIAGAWVWSHQIPPRNQPGIGSSIAVRIYQNGDSFLPIREVMRMPEGHHLPISGTITGSIRIFSNAGTISNGRILRPTRLKEEVILNWTPSIEDSTGRFKPIDVLPTEKLIELALRDQRELLANANQDLSHSDLVLNALQRGPGTRTTIWWPGVAQRVRIYAPLALALTGFLTLAGFTTLVIQRRKLRNRIRIGHCPNCGYDLAGINTITCPECGTNASSPDPGGGGAERSEAEGANPP